MTSEQNETYRKYYAFQVIGIIQEMINYHAIWCYPEDIGFSFEAGSYQSFFFMFVFVRFFIFIEGYTYKSAS